MIVKVINKSPFPLPEYKTEHAAGMDVQADLSTIGEEKSFFSRGEKYFRFPPGAVVAIPTGLYVEVPYGYELQVRPRSGMSLTTKFRIANSPGTIDADYRGEVKIILENTSTDWASIAHGDRIAQLILAPVVKIEWYSETELSETERGAGGFGSTGQ